MTWLDRAKHSIDTIADDAVAYGLVCPTEYTDLLHAAELINCLEQLEAIDSMLHGDLAGSTADARTIFYRAAVELRALVAAIEQRRRAAAA